MTIPAAIVVLLLGILFFCSGLAVNIIQALCYVLIMPLSKSTYRRISRQVAELLWLELDWWAGFKMELHTDSETFKLMGKEHALVMCNHRSDIDWLVGWVLAQDFVTAVSHMRSFAPAIYDVTVSIPKASPQPTMLRLFKGLASVILIQFSKAEKSTPARGGEASTTKQKQQ